MDHIDVALAGLNGRLMVLEALAQIALSNTAGGRVALDQAGGMITSVEAQHLHASGGNMDPAVRFMVTEARDMLARLRQRI